MPREYSNTLGLYPKGHDQGDTPALLMDVSEVSRGNRRTKLGDAMEVKSDNQKILLEAGTNEIEVLEFYVSGQSFGLNVLKVQEIIHYSEGIITKIPKSHKSVIGALYFRDKPIPVINLSEFLGFQENDMDNPRKVIMVCEFNRITLGFLATNAQKIWRMSWESILTPPELFAGILAPVTGVANIMERDILMLDFEAVTDEIFHIDAGASFAKGAENELRKSHPGLWEKRGNTLVYAADDSSIVRSRLEHILQELNYSHYKFFINGEQVLETVRNLPNDLRPKIIIADIEMPQMDGLTLCKRIKEKFPRIKVIILSSLITEQIAQKCREVHADKFLSKSEFEKIVPMVDELLFGKDN